MGKSGQVQLFRSRLSILGQHPIQHLVMTERRRKPELTKLLKIFF